MRYLDVEFYAMLKVPLEHISSICRHASWTRTTKRMLLPITPIPFGIMFSAFASLPSRCYTWDLLISAVTVVMFVTRSQLAFSSSTISIRCVSLLVRFTKCNFSIYPSHFFLLLIPLTAEADFLFRTFEFLSFIAWLCIHSSSENESISAMW